MGKPKILIAEDSSSMQTFYTLQLPDDRFEKKIVGNGKEALDIYDAWKPDLIILDINMPVLDGYETLKTLRGEKRDGSTPVVIVSSQSDKEKVMSCAELGIHCYVLKPFRIEELLDKISACLNAKDS